MHQLIKQVNLKFITPFFIFFYSCQTYINNSSNLNKYDSIRCFKVTQNFPIINNSGKLLRYDTMVAWVYYYNEQILYYSSYDFYLDTSLTTKGKSEVRYRHFVYTKGNDYGSVYDKHYSEFNKKVLVDSVARTEWTINSGFDPFVHNNLTLVSSHKIRGPGTLSEIYSFRGKKDTSINGIVELLYSSKYKKGGYSFSEKLDSVKKLKLYKIIMVNNSRFMKEAGVTLDRAEEYAEFEEVPVINRKEIMEYFKRDQNSNQRESNMRKHDQ